MIVGFVSAFIGGALGTAAMFIVTGLIARARFRRQVRKAEAFLAAHRPNPAGYPEKRGAS